MNRINSIKNFEGKNIKLSTGRKSNSVHNIDITIDIDRTAKFTYSNFDQIFPSKNKICMFFDFEVSEFTKNHAKKYC